MLESIVSKLLMRYLKEYIETIDSSQMEMALWRGKARFTNLTICSTALTNHLIPFKISKGIITLIELEFPWKHLSTEPCMIRVEDVYIVLELEKDIIIKRDLQPKQSAIKSSNNDDYTDEDEEETWQSIIDMIFDNVKVDIERIHVRLEIPGEFNTLAFGLIIPSITLRTVDKDKNEIKADPNDVVTRKRLYAHDISLYLDTLSDPIGIDEFSYVMKLEMKKNHQFIIEPFSIDACFVHSKEKTNPLKNQIDILMTQINICLDYLQSRAIMKLRNEWNMFQRQRYFSHCMRPTVFENTAQLWNYTYRCAVSINKPYNFKPGLALTILKNRKLYLSQMRKTQQVSSISMYQSFKFKKLQKIEKIIGEEATFFLREYCNAILVKEKIQYENNLTPLEISDMRQIHSSKGDFFTKDSFSVCFGLNLLSISLNYSKGTPLISAKFKNLSFGYTSVGSSQSKFVKLKSIEMSSYASNNSYSIFSVKKSLPHFITFESNCNGERETTTDIIYIDSFVFRPDYKTINTAVDFFLENKDENKAKVKVIKSKNKNSMRVFKIDAFSAFKALLMFRNHRISIRNNSFSIIYPFEHENQTDELKLVISNVDFSKIGNTYYPHYAPITKMDLGLNLTIDKLSFSNVTLISEFVVDTQFAVSFTKTDLDFTANFNITPININFDSFPFEALKSFMTSIKLISFLVIVADIEESKKIISFQKVNVDIKVIIASILLGIKEKQINTELSIFQVEFTAQFFRGISSIKADFESLRLSNNKDELIKLDNALSLKVSHRDETSPSTLSISLKNPYFNADMSWIKQIKDVILMYFLIFDEIATQSTEQETPDLNIHLDIVISNPLIEISHDPNAPYLIADTIYVHDDENFKIFVDLEKLMIKRNDFLVLKQTDLSISVATQNEILVFMDFPVFEMHASQIEYTYILPFISHLLEVLPIEKTSTKTITKVDMTIRGLDFAIYDNDYNFILGSIGKTRIEVIILNENIDVTLYSNQLKIEQKYDDTECKPMLDFEQFKLKYASNDTIDNITIDIPTGVLGLSEYFISFLPFFTNFDYPPYPLPRKDSLMSITINLQPITLVLFDFSKTIFELELGKSQLNMLFDTRYLEKTELSIEIENIFGSSSLLTEKIFEIDDILKLSISKQLFKLNLKSISIAISSELVLELITFASPLKTIQMQDQKNEQIQSEIPFDFDISIDEIKLKAATLMLRGPNCFCKIANTRFIINICEEIAMFSIDSIIMSSGYNNLKTKMFLSLEKLLGILSFSEKSFNKFTSHLSDSQIFDAIYSLDHKQFKPKSIETIFLNIKIPNLNIVYTHQMALAIIGCFISNKPKSENNKETRRLSYSYSENNVVESQPLNIHISMTVKSLSFSLAIIDPIALFKIDDILIKGSNEGLNLIVRSATIENPYINREMEVPLFSSSNNQSLISLSITNLNNIFSENYTCSDITEISIIFMESSIFFDYAFWIPIFSFLTQSPFLHLQSISTTSKDNINQNVFIPYKISISNDKLHLLLPVSTNFKTTQILHFDMGYTASYFDNILNASINNLSVYVSDQIKKINYAPIISNMSFSLENSIFEPKRIKLHAIISPIKIILSAFDFILLDKITHSFQESIGSLIVSADTYKDSKHESANIMSDVHLDIGTIKIFIVKDNRSSEQFTPIFKLKNTPINLKMNSFDDITITLEISPYIKYFNEISGQWDLIIEPLSMNVDFLLSQNAFSIQTKSSKPININLPTSAISQYLDLWGEIKNNITQEDIVFEKLPQLWLQNNLGSDVIIKYKENSLSKARKEIVIKRFETTKIHEFKSNSKIIIICDGHQEVIRTRFLNYPTMYSKSFSVVRKQYRGGILIQFNPPVQLINSLSIDFNLYLKNGDEYIKISQIKSGQRFPLDFNDGKAKEYTFTDPQFKDTSKNLVAKISPFETSNFNITIFKVRKIRCVIFVEFESSVSKVFKVMPYVLSINLLPFSLYIRYYDGIDFNIKEVEPNTPTEMLFVDSSSKLLNASISLEKDQFYDELSEFSIKKNLNSIDIYPNETIALRSEVIDDQLIIFFFSPCVFYNTFSEESGKSIIIKEVVTSTTIGVTRPPIEKEIKCGKYLLWCPPSYIKDDGQLSVYVSTPKSEQNFVNCLDFQKGILYLQSKAESDLYDGIRYKIVKRNNISVATFSPLLIVRNELNLKITLQPIEKIPNNFNDDILTIGCPTIIKPKSEHNMELMSPNGYFIVWIEGFWNSPSLSMLEQRKIVFKMHTETSYEIMEVEIFDVQTSYIAVFRRSSYPTPIVIANMLTKDELIVYQKIESSPIIVSPESTSMFAFDEPLGYPNAHIIIGNLHFNISLIEDTDQMLLEQNTNNIIPEQEKSNSAESLPLKKNTSRLSLLNECFYVKIKQNISGVRTIFISNEKEEQPNGFKLNFAYNISDIFISIIDLKMREFALLTLSNMKGKLDIAPTGTAFHFELKELQIDDQNALAPNPVIFHGRNSDKYPFLRIDALLTSDSKLLTSFKYISVLMQRIDVSLDSSFISDAVNMSTKIAKPINLPIQPVQTTAIPKTSSSSMNQNVTYNWLEVSPIFLIVNYKNLTGRPTTVAPMLYPLRFIPTISPMKLLFPGIIVAHITDRLDFIIEKVSSDYKTAALEQVLESLGTSGKLMTTLGITATIAEKLDIVLKSELTDSIQSFQSKQSEEFDNRREINGCFSQQTLSDLQKCISDSNLTPSHTIESLTEQNESNIQSDPDGLMIRDFPGSGFGHGIVGVLKKASIDTLDDIKVMSGIERKRVPRSFPNNRIEKFDEEICNVQNTIQITSKTFETIQMKTKRKDNGEYIVLTDLTVYYLLPPYDKIRFKIKIKEIKSIKIENHTIIFEYGILKKLETIVCNDEYEAECFVKFLESQRIYSDLFTKSIV